MKRMELTRFAPLDYAGAEALNTLCTNLSFCGSSVKKIMITSCHAAEGKSYLTMNLMRKMAELGKKVIMVDADLRRSRIGSKYGMRVVEGRALGLTHYLAGMCGVDEVVYATNIPGAYMVPVGHEVSNSLALLTHEHFKRLLDELAREYDLVLVDAPPVGIIIDAAEIAKSCDGVLLAVGYNSTTRRELIDTKKQIERTGCTILGVVLNNVKLDSLSTKRYYHKSYYANYTSDYYKPVKTAKRSGKSKESVDRGK